MKIQITIELEKPKEESRIDKLELPELKKALEQMNFMDLFELFNEISDGKIAQDSL